MKRITAAALIAVVGIGASYSALAGSLPAPQAAQNDPFFAAAQWDDDDNDDFHIPGRRITPMPVPDAAAIRRTGVVRVTKIERDNGRIEVEGYDAQGREIDLDMDRTGKRVLSYRIDRDD